MHRSKLIRLIKILDPDEFRLFYKFVRSIFYQNNQNLVNLYKYLRKYYPDFPPSKINKEKVFQHLFPGRPYSNDTLASLMSKLTRLVEEYLLILDLQDDAFERKKRLIRIYGKRNQFDFFEKGTKELLKELEQESLQNHQERIALYKNLYFHPLHNKYSLEDESLEHLMDNLDHYFTLSKMRYGVALKNKQKILSKPYDLKFMEILTKEQELGSSVPPVFFELYRYTFALLEENTTSDFYKFEQLFFAQAKTLDLEDQMLLYLSGLNYINRQVNNGHSAFSSIAFKWYKYGLSNDLLIKNNNIDQVTFGNIVVYGCREKQFDWTKSFISTYESYLDPEIKTDIVNYNLAWLHISMKEFHQALSILTNYPFKEKDQAKTRLNIIRAMFELFLTDERYYSLLTANIHSFEVFISRNTFFKKSTLKPYLNGIRIIRGLATRIQKKEEMQTIRTWFLHQIQSKQEIIARSWLSEKVNDFC